MDLKEKVRNEVISARILAKTVDEAVEEILSLFSVVQQSEQLKICDCDEPKPDIMTDSYCLTCLGSTN